MFDDLAEWFVNLVLDELTTVVSNLTEEVVKAGDDENADDGTQQHSTDRGGTDGPVSDRSRPRGANQWNQTRDECEGSHQNRSESQLAAFNRGFLQADTFVMPLDREFDDQNGILTEQADQHDQPNLTVNIICQSHLLQEQERTEDPNGQRQNHGQRQDEALVLSNENKVDEDHDDDEDVDRQVSFVGLIIRETFPAQTVTAR